MPSPFPWRVFWLSGLARSKSLSPLWSGLSSRHGCVALHIIFKPWFFSVYCKASSPGHWFPCPKACWWLPIRLKNEHWHWPYGRWPSLLPLYWGRFWAVGSRTTGIGDGFSLSISRSGFCLQLFLGNSLDTGKLKSSGRQSIMLGWCWWSSVSAHYKWCWIGARNWTGLPRERLSFWALPLWCSWPILLFGSWARNTRLSICHCLEIETLR